MITQRQFDLLLPLACSWAAEQEQRILSDGVSLSVEQLADASAIGVKHADRVRLLRVARIPTPENPMLRVAAEAMHLISSGTLGATLGYGIFIRSDHWNDRSLIVHELVHISQYERLGGFQPFLKQYLTECNTMGYSAAPLEQEAIMTAAAIMGREA